MKRIKNKLFVFQSSNEFMFYKYDLTIYLFMYCITLMWKPTFNNTRTVNRYLSFSMINTNTYHRYFHKRIGKLYSNPKYI